MRTTNFRAINLSDNIRQQRSSCPRIGLPRTCDTLSHFKVNTHEGTSRSDIDKIMTIMTTIMCCSHKRTCIWCFCRRNVLGCQQQVLRYCTSNLTFCSLQDVSDNLTLNFFLKNVGTCPQERIGPIFLMLRFFLAGPILDLLIKKIHARIIFHLQPITENKGSLLLLVKDHQPESELLPATG